jgi:hypothetical protein
MSSLMHLRRSLVLTLICSLVLSGLFNITTRRSHASNNSLPHSSTPPIDESSEKTAPQAETVDEVTRSRVSEAFGKLPLSFEENRGQVDNVVKYFSRGQGYTLFLTPTEAVLSLSSSDGKKATPNVDARSARMAGQPRRTRTSVVRMKLRGASHAPAITGKSEMRVRTNYFKGNDPAKWQTDVARYERVRYQQVYPGIDMIYYGQQQQLEYDFEVAAGADARQIALEFRGVKRVTVERESGELVLETGSGEVRQRKPITYQEVEGQRRNVASRYVMQGKRQVGIEVGEYDRTKRLVIDPVLSYSTFLGGRSVYGGNGIAVDSSGNAYVTGYAYSAAFPTLNQYQTWQGYNDAIVTKLDTNASGAASLLYSTCLGGSSSHDYGTDIAVDSSGHAYVTGLTYSSDFPTLNHVQAFQGAVDAFVAKLDTNASGAASLLYSTYLGGSSNDYGSGIAIDSSGNAYVTGSTRSRDFPTSWRPLQSDYFDAFVAKFSTEESGQAHLTYSTCLGGSINDGGRDIAVDSSGIAYVTGVTESTNFPTRNQYQKYQGGKDAFVAKLDTNAAGAAAFLYSTYLGGRPWDIGMGIALDSSGHVYVTGTTYSRLFPTKNQYQTNQGYSDAFVTKLDTNAAGAASLLYSTCLGGTDADNGTGITVDASGHAYVTGLTYSSNFPTLNQLQTDQGSVDAFVTKLNTNAAGAASLLYSTYLGGVGTDEGYSIAVDSSGNAYVTGQATSSDFPMLNQFQTHQEARGGLFVTKLKDTTMIGGRVMSDRTTGLSGVTIKLSGSQSRTAVTDSTGNYAFLNLPLGGTYTVTPQKTGYQFTPASKTFTNLIANKRAVNFAVKVYSISGHITRTGTTTGISAVTVTITSPTPAGFPARTVQSYASGNYWFYNLPAGRNYTIKPSKSGWTFSPQTRQITNLSSNIPAGPSTNFTGTGQ